VKSLCHPRYYVPFSIIYTNENYDFCIREIDVIINRAENINRRHYSSLKSFFYSSDKFWNKMQISENLCLAKFVESVKDLNVNAHKTLEEYKEKWVSEITFDPIKN